MVSERTLEAKKAVKSERQSFTNYSEMIEKHQVNTIFGRG